MNDAIHIQDLRVWAHVGVLERERLEGQWFSLDLTLLVDLQAAARSDVLTDTADYSLAVQAVQALASELRCRTIEHFSERVLVRLANLYGSVPMRLVLRKTKPPIPGFSGTVAIERHRHWPASR
jgi:dihydroneopterin aldolase